MTCPTKKLGEEKDKNDVISTWWNTKKTETEWIKIQDRFFLRCAPQWFKFLGWLFLLGALRYIHSISRSRIVLVLYVISFIILYFYLQSFLYNFPFYKLLPAKFVRSERFAFVFSITVAGILLLLLYFYLLEAIIEKLVVK